MLISPIDFTFAVLFQHCAQQDDGRAFSLLGNDCHAALQATPDFCTSISGVLAASRTLVRKRSKGIVHIETKPNQLRAALTGGPSIVTTKPCNFKAELDRIEANVARYDLKAVTADGVCNL